MQNRSVKILSFCLRRCRAKLFYLNFYFGTISLDHVITLLIKAWLWLTLWTFELNFILKDFFRQSQEDEPTQELEENFFVINYSILFHIACLCMVIWKSALIFFHPCKRWDLLLVSRHDDVVSILLSLSCELSALAN